VFVDGSRARGRAGGAAAAVVPRLCERADRRFSVAERFERARGGLRKSMRQILHTLSRHPLMLAGGALLAALGAAALIAHLVSADLRQQSRLMNVSCRGPAGTGPE